MTDAVSFPRMYARTLGFTVGVPRASRISPEGDRVLFLRAETGEDRRNSLWSLDLSTGNETKLVDVTTLLASEEDLPPEEQARRERAREASGGIVSYSVTDDFRLVVFSLSGKIYTLDLTTMDITEVIDSAVIDPRPNSSGTHIGYVRERAFCVIDVHTGVNTVLAEESDSHVTWGLAEFIAAEEMDRHHGYWWSPDGTRILVQRTDESQVKRWYIGNPAKPEQETRNVAYPAAGTTNATVSLAFFDLTGSRIDVESGDWEYIASVHWSTSGNPLIAVQSRDQRRMEIREINPLDGTTQLLHTEEDSRWVDVIDGVPAWTTDGRLVRVSVDDETYRLFVGDKPVTPLGLNVRGVLHVGAEVLFSASDEDPTQIHIYRTAGDEIQRLSSIDGVNMGAGNADSTAIASLDMSGRRTVIMKDGEIIGQLNSVAVEPTVQPRVQFLTVGERRLRCALILPRDLPQGETLPVLLRPYGGPHGQLVLRGRTAPYLQNQWLADQGFAVLVVDGRGTPGRGPKWDREVFEDFAGATLDDQVDALQAVAKEHSMLDLNRVAIWGWSYGGYLAALAVLRRPDVFHAAIAGAPVTDWSLYDTHYTERYLGLPDSEVYRRNSLLHDAKNLRRALMIIHGLADDNVFVAHALRLSEELTAAGRPHTFIPLTGATHMAPRAEEAAENLMLLQVSWLKKELARVDELSDV